MHAQTLTAAAEDRPRTQGGWLEEERKQSKLPTVRDDDRAEGQKDRICVCVFELCLLVSKFCMLSTLVCVFPMSLMMWLSQLYSNHNFRLGNATPNRFLLIDIDMCVRL